MHLGAVTYNVLKDWDVETIIKNLEAAGFEAVELRTTHKHGVEPSIGAEERNRVKQRFERSKIRLLCYGTTCEFHSPDAAVRRQNVETGKQFVDLAHDTGAWGIKVRPNGLPKEVPRETTIANIGASLRELGEYGQGKGVEIWLEVHGRDTSVPSVAAAIMRATQHKNVGLCWNSNEADITGGSVKQSFELLKPWVKHAHINELSNPRYPWRELFTLLRQAGYDRYTMCEAQESKEPERYLRWYKALWTELNRPCSA
jgi:sugar phosphate isomerase/epimerase